MPLSLLTLNIEEDKHLELILPYLQSEKFDVVCLQEVFEKDLTVLSEAASAKALFTPLSMLNGHVWGIAILIRQELPIQNTVQKLYKGSPDDLPVFTHDNPNIVNRGIVSTGVERNSLKYQISTTHFTWTPNGKTTDEQQRDFSELKKVLAEIGPTVLCGDFNAARGINPVFSELAKQYKDNVPQDVVSSIDPNLHRVKGLQLMVDGFFTTPEYVLKDVQMLTGLSDHQGIRGNVYLNEEILL